MVPFLQVVIVVVVVAAAAAAADTDAVFALGVVVDDVVVTLISVLSPPTMMINITRLCVWSSVSVIVYLLLNPESQFFFFLLPFIVQL